MEAVGYDGHQSGGQGQCLDKDNASLATLVGQMGVPNGRDEVNHFC
jgi:hypothetical protein